MARLVLPLSSQAYEMTSTAGSSTFSTDTRDDSSDEDDVSLIDNAPSPSECESKMEKVI